MAISGRFQIRYLRKLGDFCIFLNICMGPVTLSLTAFDALAVFCSMAPELALFRRFLL